jgi:hypothetical protein
MRAIDAKTGKQYWRRVALLWGMFGFFGLVISAMAKTPALGLFGLFLMIAPAYMLVSRRMTWVARLDGDGVTMHSGKRFAWSDFEKVVDVHALRGGAKWHNHYELVFKSGRARVFDRMLANRDEVVGALQALERGENPFTGAQHGEPSLRA